MLFRAAAPRDAGELVSCRYAAFISYSKVADGRLAPALQQGLERMAKPWYRARALRVFRDDTGLAVTEALWPAIARELDRSAFLVLLLSPGAAESDWVDREVEHWRLHCSGRPLLLVLAEGECYWDRDRADFDPTRSTAVPKALLGAFAEEPRWVDLRWARGMTQLDLRHSRFRDAVAQIAAPLHDRPKDDLESTDVRLHRRTMRLVWSVVATLLVLALVASFGWNNSVRQRRLAEEQTEIATARSLIAEAAVRRPGDVRRALQLGVAADRVHSSAESRAGLYASLTATSLVATIADHSDLVTDVALGPDNHTLASSSWDGSVSLWDVGDPLHPVRLGTVVESGTAMNSVAFSPDGTVLATSGNSGAELWDLKDRTRPVLLGSIDTGDSAINDVAFSPDGTVLATAGDDGRAGLWIVADRAHPTLSASLDTLGLLYGVQFSPDGNTLLTAGQDGADLWGVSDLAQAGYLNAVGDATTRTGANSAVFSPDGRTVAVAAADDTVYLWDVRDPARPRRLGQFRDQMDSVDVGGFSPDGRNIVIAGADIAAIWDVSNPATPSRTRELRGHTGHVDPARFSPDGRTVVTASGDKTVGLWAVDHPVQPVRRTTVTAQTTNIAALAISVDGRMMATGGSDTTVGLWDLTDPAGPARTATVTMPSPVQDVLFLPDDRTLLVATFDGVEVFDLTDRANPSRVASMQEGGTVFAMAVGPDGHTVVLGAAQGRAGVWDLKVPSAPVRSASLDGHERPVGGVAIASDGRTAATMGGEGVLRIWDITDPAAPITLSVIEGTSPFGGLTFTQAGRILAAGVQDDAVAMWDLTDRAEPLRVATLFGHTDAVYDLTFSPDGRLLATGSADQTAALWDVTDTAAPAQLATLPDIGGSVLTLDILPDGNTLATGSGDSSAVLWDIVGSRRAMDDPAVSACAAAGGGLSEEMWEALEPGVAYRHTC